MLSIHYVVMRELYITNPRLPNFSRRYLQCLLFVGEKWADSIILSLN